jgi:hypothetical protein
MVGGGGELVSTLVRVHGMTRSHEAFQVITILSTASLQDPYSCLGRHYHRCRLCDCYRVRPRMVPRSPNLSTATYSHSRS